jgi:hypothetical protein
VSRPSAGRPGAAARQPGRGNSFLVAGALLACAVAAIGGWLWVSHGDDLVDKTLGMERSILAAEVSGRAGRRLVDEIIRNVDRMQPHEVQEVQRTLEEEWQRVRREDVEAYFAAKPEEKRSILDRSIDRAFAYTQLRFAVDPKAWSMDGRPRKSRKRSGDAQTAGGTGPEADAQRQLLERYDDALRQRARERRIDLPAWQ